MKIRRENVKWVPTRYLKIRGTEQYEFQLDLYKPLSDWDVFDSWEKERIRHMRQTLERGEILFDIGAEVGWMSVIYGQMVHPMNMVLIEPTAEFWPNIEAVWHRNFDAEPLFTYHGLFSNKTTSKEVKEGWPKASKGNLIDKLSYTYIHDNPKKIPEITLDEFVKQTGIVPNALTMDTEGSELLILQGAVETLSHRNLKVWVSVHPDLGERDYGVKPGEVVEFMKKHGYDGTHLATDHEEHWYFSR